MNPADKQPVFTVIGGEPSDAAIQALAALLLELVDQDAGGDQDQDDGD